ncbi:hypothetical protein ABXS75_10625 [Roseburia hominis]
MLKRDVERYAFLYLCGIKDREILSGRRKMTFIDFERLTYLAQCLGFLDFQLEIWEKYACLFDDSFGRTEDLLKESERECNVEPERCTVEEATDERQRWVEEFCQNSRCEEIRDWFIEYL